MAYRKKEITYEIEILSEARAVTLIPENVNQWCEIGTIIVSGNDGTVTAMSSEDFGNSYEEIT